MRIDAAMLEKHDVNEHLLEWFDEEFPGGARVEDLVDAYPHVDLLVLLLGSSPIGVCRGMLKHGVWIDSVDGHGMTALCYAGYIGSVANVRFLIEQGASVRHVSKDGNSTLHWAVLGGSAYSYFRYESHLASLGALEVHHRIEDEFSSLFGRTYSAVETYCSQDAAIVFVMIGSFATKAKDAVDRLREDEPVVLSPNEWLQARRHGDTYWLYVVWGCKTEEKRLLPIPNPAKALARDAEKLVVVKGYLLSADALTRFLD